MSVLAFMTTSGHNVTMKQIKIADLKARLSEHLRAVRAGETIAVLDRDTPVAHIVPIRARHTLRVRKPSPGAPPLYKVALPGPAGLKTDVVRVLLEERQSHR
jgi:antitoxin (DNA-binding transcriptional repressor) of toxin-antitoxin stability system